MTLSTNPPRWTQDRDPKEFSIRHHIFTTWRKVCLQFWYEEYLGPLVEDAAIWRAKSGEDVGGTELTLISDREGKLSDLALRPEMTPSVTRMVTKSWPQLPKPVRRFSIANFYRNERPQRWRNREFRQLNVDLFGEKSLQADLEALQMGIEIMLAFSPPKDSFVIYINHRSLIDTFLLEVAKIDNDKKQDVVRLMDKREKLDQSTFVLSLTDLGVNTEQADAIVRFMSSSSVEEIGWQFEQLKSNQAVVDIHHLLEQLHTLWYAQYVTFKPSLMRGFDYYDGMVFEVFDKHPDNNRAMFGGGRYNGLASIFGAKEEIPAVGFAPGDEPMRLFLESWGMLEAIAEMQPEAYYLPLLDESLVLATTRLAHKLRSEGKRVELGLTVKKFPKALEYANKKNYSHMVVYWTEEHQASQRKIKDLKSGTETIVK